MANVPYELDLDNILDVAVQGVRRASIFMGLGVNAALNTEFNNYQLSHITNIQLVPNVPTETVNHFKEEFKTWIEANGFRELVETFSSFLDQLHYACLLAKEINRRPNIHELQERQKGFEKEGFPNKLNLLDSSFSVAPKHTKYLKSLNKARNCLTHRRGIVGREDVAPDNCLSVSWLGMDVYVETPTGEKHMLNQIPEGGIYLENGGAVMVGMVERKRVFPIEVHLQFSTRDLAEICWFFDREARAALSSAVDFARKTGITINEKKI